MLNHLTRIKHDIAKLEDKEELTQSGQRKIKHLKEQATKYYRDFEQCDVKVLNFFKAADQAALDSEEAIVNGHVNCVSNFIERLEKIEDLVATTEPVMPHASDGGHGQPGAKSITDVEHLSRRLCEVHNSLIKVKKIVEDKEFDMCLLEEYEEILKCTDTDLKGIQCGMLLIDDYESLAGRAAGLEEASFELRVAIKHLLKNIKAKCVPSSTC